MRTPPLPITTVTLIVAVVGVVDAGIGRVWDLFAMFLVVAIMQTTVLLSAINNRRPVSLRPDLARWVLERSHRTGEPATEVIDRAVAWFQHGLYRAPGPDEDS